MKAILQGNCQHEIKVTYLGNETWGVRCFVNGELNQEIQVYCKEDISTAAREMLRWEDKCGNISKYASSSRERHIKEYKTFVKKPKFITLSEIEEKTSSH